MLPTCGKHTIYLFSVLHHFIFLFFFINIKLNAQNVSTKTTINGYVKEAGSMETLAGVRVYAPGLNASTITNTFGFYSLSVQNSDSTIIVFSCSGYQNYTLQLSPEKKPEINIVLLPSTEVMTEVTIQGQPKLESKNVQMSTINIPIAQMKDIPGFLGEKDMLKVLQLMPGVQKGREGNSGLYVRGGGPDQNLVLLDGATIYNAFHLFGFYSLFNGDALKSVELTKGGFPARYGGRLSSIAEMTMKDGNKEKLKGEGGIGIISSKLTLEGPLFKNKSSFLISARRTYLDLLVKPFLPKSKNATYYFFDLNGKVHYEINAKNKIFLSTYWGGDKLKVKDSDDYDKSTWDGKLAWGNITATARWNHLFSNKIFSNTSFIFSNFKMEGEEISKRIDYNTQGSFSSFIRDFTIKSDIEYHPNPGHSIRTGALLIHHTFNPIATAYANGQPEDSKKTGTQTQGLEAGIYLEDTYKPFSKVSLNGGLRLSYYRQANKTYLNLEPRFNAAFHITDRFSIKGCYSLMNQYLHLLSYTKVGLPADLWVPAINRILPQRSQQVAIGLAKDFPAQNIYLTVETYYKKSSNIIAYKNGANFLSLENNATENWEHKVLSGKGWSYGAEFLLHKKYGKISGWLGYTISWSKVQFDFLNAGKAFYSAYDRRHDASVVVIYKPNTHITISSTWVYGSGNRITMPIGTYKSVNDDGHFNNDHKTFFTNKNDYIMPAYHRCDLGIQFHKQLKKDKERTWEISIYNVYNRQNPYFYYIVASGQKDSVKRKVKQVVLFPILPSVSYKIKF